MTTHSHALIAAAAPLIGLASALPQHYVSRPVLVEDAFRSIPEKEGITIKLVSLEEPKDEQGSSNYEGASETECATDGKFTYFSEQPLPGAENDSILIEECDPSDPNQIRLAYVANRSFKNKLSPTSILIGCTGTSPKSFKARNGGAFAKITSSGTYTNFVKRNFAAVNTIPIVKSAGDKRTQQLQVEDGNSRLARRWETRSDIDQYSDGYHTCQSAGSSACRLIVPKQVCPDLQKALEGSLKDTSVKMEKRIVCSPEGAADMSNCSDLQVGKKPAEKQTDLTKRGVDTSDVGDRSAIVDREKKELNKDARTQIQNKKEEEHQEFMRRWLQGDEHPRSFQVRSEKAVEEEEIIHKRAIAPKKSFKYNDLDARQERRNERDHSHPHGDESDDNENDDDDDDQDDKFSCDGSDQFNDHCRNRALRDRNVQRLNEQDEPETLPKARSKDNSFKSDNDDCSDASDANKDYCKRLRGQGRLYAKQNKEASLQKRSLVAKREKEEGIVDKRDRYSDKYSVKSYQSRDSKNSRDSYRPRRNRMQRRGATSIVSEDLLEKRGHYRSKDMGSVDSFNSQKSRNSSRNYRREAKGNGEEAAMVKRSNNEESGKQISLERRSNHRGRGRSYSPDNSRRGIQEDEADLVEKRSNHRGRGRSYSPHSRRGVDDQVGDLLEKRSNHRGGRGRSYSPKSRRGLEEHDANMIEKRSSHRGGWRGYRSHSRSRREVKDDVEVGILKRGLAPRDLVGLYDDVMTVRSALSEQGDIFERGQDSFNELLGKREVYNSTMASEEIVKAPTKMLVAHDEAAEKLSKRDLATSIWRLSVAPLIQRRTTSATVFKRDVA